MRQTIFEFIWLCIYWYYVEQSGDIEKGCGKRALSFGLTAAVLVCSFRVPVWLAWFLIVGIIVLYDLFFDGEPFRYQWWRMILPGLCIVVGPFLPEQTVFALHGGVMLVFLLLLAEKRDSLRLGNGALTTVSYAMIAGFLWLIGCTEQMEMADSLRELLLWGGVVLEALLLLAVEGTLFFYKKGFDFRTELFRTELMEHQYAEIRSVYMDMRGWRHDYHNHMQVMKAQLSMGNLDEIRAYLDKLEQELDRVDTYVKSGNLMVDAIALVEKGSRFLRVYMTVNKSQLYLSVQNSAKEEPEFEAINYITRKRGNHGLGMKWVKAAVDKYGGYLNLANEPEIFVAEVTMPLDIA